MKQGIVGLIVLLLGMLIFVILFVTVTSKLLKNDQITITTTNPKEVQKTVDDLQNKLQQKQNESLGSP